MEINLYNGIQLHFYSYRKAYKDTLVSSLRHTATTLPWIQSQLSLLYLIQYDMTRIHFLNLNFSHSVLSTKLLQASLY